MLTAKLCIYYNKLFCDGKVKSKIQGCNSHFTSKLSNDYDQECADILLRYEHFGIPVDMPLPAANVVGYT